MLLYVFDTNFLSDAVVADQREAINMRLLQALAAGATLVLCWPVYYELQRGFIKAKAAGKQQYFEEHLVPLFTWVDVQPQDWLQAAQLWADARNQGRQLSDVDLLLAAIALRLSATVITADDDFDALPVARANWRPAPPPQ